MFPHAQQFIVNGKKFFPGDIESVKVIRANCCSMQIERIIYHIKTIIITNISYKCLFILHCIIWMRVCIVAICILQFIIISFGKQCSISFYKNSSGRQKDKQMCSTDTEKQGKRYKGSDKFQILTFQTVRYWTCSDGLSASCDIYCTKTLDAQNTFCSDKRKKKFPYL